MNKSSITYERKTLVTELKKEIIEKDKEKQNQKLLDSCSSNDSTKKRSKKIHHATTIQSSRELPCLPFKNRSSASHHLTLITSLTSSSLSCYTHLPKSLYQNQAASSLPSFLESVYKVTFHIPNFLPLTQLPNFQGLLKSHTRRRGGDPKCNRVFFLSPSLSLRLSLCLFPLFSARHFRGNEWGRVSQVKSG